MDIAIIGGGHAGIEAAWASSQFPGVRVALVSKPGVPLASTPCNPAIGGVGKGQLVREIDAMGGLMGMIADKSAIQCRRLNESKGYAVQSTRFQVDKDLYPEIAEEIIQTRENIHIFRESVFKINQTANGFEILTEKTTIKCNSVVMTVGTFLDGQIHRGLTVSSGGRDGNEASGTLNSIFSGVSKLKKKFKTGTPARILESSIDKSLMSEQLSDDSVENFHVLHGTKRFLPQVSCYKTATSKRTIETILENKELSPMFNGQITGVGPRYCPSIEDKAFRYPDRFEHHVFVEPEGLKSGTVYPNGVSTSLPEEVQLDFIRSIKGFENATIEKYGYAVEYEVIDTSSLSLSLEHDQISGLFFAGQVNGTSGYEEAAGQGLVAGLNAALSFLGKNSVEFPRGTSYLGVLIDDVVGMRRDEPYRLFTARSENRLYLREDNSIDRLGQQRLSLGLSLEIDSFIKSYLFEKELLGKALSTRKVVISNGEKVSINEKLKDSKIDPVKYLHDLLEGHQVRFSPLVVKSYAIEKKYEGYLTKSSNKAKTISKIKDKKIDWESLSNNQSISNECRQRIYKNKPKTFHHLKSIHGIRPATLSYIANGII
jgi:tRNA uridine 5-carboxymethylaminomethyl modification enzyme